MQKLLRLTATLALAGCEPPPLPAQPQVAAVQPRTYHDVAYYEANPIERRQAVEWCGNNPGLQGAKNPSCDSAIQANTNAWRQKIYGQQAADPTQNLLGGR